MAGRRPHSTSDSTDRAAGPEFVHLHVHSEFSLLDGLARIQDLVQRAAALGMKALALTDHGVLYGVIDFYTAARAAGLKPILGCEVYVAPRARTQREPKVDDKNYHLTLLARDEAGYRNLLKIVSRAHLDGFYYKPRADKELLAQHAQGLICLSGCMSGEVARLLADGQHEQARETAAWYREVFGQDGYFLEVQNQLLTGQDALNGQIVDLARRLDLPLVATNDAHYVRPEDSRAHDVLLCIQTGSTVEQGNRMRMETPEFYLRSGAEMARAFDGLDEALQNTVRIAEQVQLDLTFDRVLLPHFALPDGQTPAGHLRQLCQEGLQRRYGTVTERHRERLEYELSVIERTGYPLYFLIVADYVRFARERGILAVPRGSVAGSIAIYALGICDVDPLKYGLMFERFLHEERIGMPDIDMDFADDRREEVIRYVQQKYGHERVAQIITFGTMAARAAVRDVGRALGLTYGEVDRVAKTIPMGSTIAEALQNGADLQAMTQADARIQDLLDLAQSLEGIARNASTHAAGVVISGDPLEEHVPLQKATRGEEGVITQWAFGVIEKVGMLKMDLLGLANLTILDQARKIVEAQQPLAATRYSRSAGAGPALDLQNLPMDYDDPSGQAKRTYDMLGEGQTTAVFQLESAGMRRCLKGLRPNQISDLLAILALYRPGPMENIPAFIAAKNGQAPVAYLHEDLRPILEETYGVCVYQDQVLQIVRAIAGFTWGEADVLRKAMGKKIAALMAEQQEKFLARTVARGYGGEFAEQLWATIAPFAGYGFPKAHAAAYALVSYQTAFLKANYPAEYMAAVLTSEAGNAAKVAEAVAECRRLGVEVRPPDVNRSGLGFTLEPASPPLAALLPTPPGAHEGPPQGPAPLGGPLGAAGSRTVAIRFGLAGVKNVGHGAVEMLIKAREQAAGGQSPPPTQAAEPLVAAGDGCLLAGGFRSLNDFCRRVDLRQLNKRAIESLIKAGAMDGFGERAALLAGLDSAMALAQQHQRAQQVGQTTLFDLLGADGAPLALEAGQPGGAAGPWGPAPLGATPPSAADGAGIRRALPPVEPASRKQRLAWEKEMIGLYISEHPLAGMARALGAAATCATTDLAEELAGQVVTVGGFIAALRLIPTKKGDLMAAVELEDLSGSVEVLVFPRTYQAHRDILNEDVVVLVRGKVDTRDDRPKLLCESIEVFEPAPDGPRHSWPSSGEETTAAAGTQTAYPLGQVEAEAAELVDGGGQGTEGRATTVGDGASTGDRVEVYGNGALQPGAPASDGIAHAAPRQVRGAPPGGETEWGAPGTGVRRARGEPVRLLELVMERSARDERDVNRLVRLDALLDRFPGGDRVILRLVKHGRDETVLELVDGVRCCDELLLGAAKELGEQAVRVRGPHGGVARHAAAAAGEQTWVGAGTAAPIGSE